MLQWVLLVLLLLFFGSCRDRLLCGRRGNGGFWPSNHDCRRFLPFILLLLIELCLSHPLGDSIQARNILITPDQLFLFVNDGSRYSFWRS